MNFTLYVIFEVGLTLLIVAAVVFAWVEATRDDGAETDGNKPS